MWLMLVILILAPFTLVSNPLDENLQRYDGWYNNLANPDWGSIDSSLVRHVPASYEDGVYMINRSKPNPRLVSNAVFSGPNGLGSLLNRTVMLVAFGQLVSSEILMSSEAGCPIELEKIQIEKCDEAFDEDCEGDKIMPFQRARYLPISGQSVNHPRQQINVMTSWIDASVVYSTHEAWTNAIRAFTDGMLATSENSTLPPNNARLLPLANPPDPNDYQTSNPARLFISGDPRSNQHPGLLALEMVFHHWHNVLARRIVEQNPSWSDEAVFQRARRLVIASLQNIVMYEYLPIFLGDDIPPYEGYKPYVDPGISHVFQGAAYRFGHTLVPPAFYLRNGTCDFKTTSHHPVIRMCNIWWDADSVLREIKFEDLIRGMISQIAEREDAVFCTDVRNDLFSYIGYMRRDLAAINILRGRDLGLPSYNTVRRAFNFSPVRTFEEINPDFALAHPETIHELEELYESVDNLDLFVGGMVETRDGPGELFRAIIKDQFLRIRDGDRFWFENTANGIFTPEEIQHIRQLTLWDVIVNSTKVLPGEIQRGVFRWVDGDPCPQPEQLNGSILPPCHHSSKFDYFQENQYSYIATCVLLFIIPILCCIAAFATVRLMANKRRRIKLKMSSKNSGEVMNKLVVKEWLHENLKRIVKIKFGTDQTLYVVSCNGLKQRSINFASIQALDIEISETERKKKPMTLIRVPRDHDLVLQFNSESARQKFIDKLDSFLASFQKDLVVRRLKRSALMDKAETKEKRERKLEYFFREAYSLAFGITPKVEKGASDFVPTLSLLLQTSLSKQEFASALGMKENSLFVQQMFNITDKDGNGRISFQEFLDTVVLFSRGKVEDKLKVLFDMIDSKRNGIVKQTDMIKLIKSLIEMAKTEKMTEDEVNDLIRDMFSSTGLTDRPFLNFKDFTTLLKGYKAQFIGLHLKGAKQNYLDAPEKFTIETTSDEAKERYVFINSVKNLLSTYLEEYRQHTFIVLLFFVITIGLFVDRFINYTLLSEHTDLRHVLGVGIAITRGSAASLSFCFCLLLLTMSRNLLTKLKEYPINQFIPLDSHVGFHKIVAVTGLMFTLLHTCGHIVNFYHISTQTEDNLRCLASHLTYLSYSKPTFLDWVFGTLTGLTGVFLYIIVCIIFVFSHPIIRKNAFKYFWRCHFLYVALFALSLLHGLMRVSGSPRFWFFFIGPGIIFALDQIVTLRTRCMELEVLETELLPSDVIKIKFFRPPNFKYLSGHWVKITHSSIQPVEFHSFTLTSSPHENYLMVHVKAQGPWTWKLRSYYDPGNVTDEHDGKIRIEGPFGGGNQDWFKFEVAIMIGGGIGVTPYASMLKDLVFGTSTNRYSGVACKKVYFMWVCPSQKHFEWFIDILKEVEQKDVTGVLEIHIFITQFFHKFDLRTTMLYICEKHFQNLSKKSMFTGLKAQNHFGRPDMPEFFRFVKKRHHYVNKVGVFSCGPPVLTNGITKACLDVNKERKSPYFVHQFENFG